MTEPTCQFCGLVDKHRCRDAETAEECPHAPAEGKAPLVRSGPLVGLARRKYGAIYADPPWTFTTRSDKGKGRSPEMHYDCMTLDEIKAMPVEEIAAEDCVLFLWVIDTHLQMALDVIRDWGFTYKTRAFEWVKLQAKIEDWPLDRRDPINGNPFFMGGGFWTRANPESCLLATKGSPKRLDAGVRRLIASPLREHSRKPDEAYERIEALVAGPYCELFSRSTRPGWDQMGNEKGKFDPGRQPQLPSPQIDLEDAIFDKEVEDLV